MSLPIIMCVCAVSQPAGVCLPLPGAAQTMEKLMNKPDTRTAAVTMLGKTVEYCQPQVWLQR